MGKAEATMKCIKFGNVILIAAITSSFGCNSSTTRTEFVPDRPTGPHFGWYQTLDEEPDYLLVTKLTIPDVFNEQVQEIRVRRYMRIDANGAAQFPPRQYFGGENSDGHNEKGGFGYGGAINIVDDPADGPEADDSTLLDVGYDWTTSDQMRGHLKEKVPVKVGVPLDIALKKGCRLSVRWQKVNRAPPG